MTTSAQKNTCNGPQLVRDRMAYKEQLQTHRHMVWPVFKAVLLTTLVAVTLYSIVKLIQELLWGEKWSTSTNIEQVKLLPLPTLIVCNFNRVRTSKAKALNITESNLMTYVTRTNNGQTMYKQLQADKNTANVTLVEHFFAAVLASLGIDKGLLNMHHWPPGVPVEETLQFGLLLYQEFVRDHPGMTLQKLMELLTSNCIETVVMGKFAGKAINAMLLCNASRFTFNDGGVCFTLALPENMNQIVPGGEMGLMLSMFTDVADSLPLVLHNNIDAGFKLYLTFEPDAVVFLPIVVAPGTHAYVELTTTKEVTDDTGSLFTAPCSKDKKTKFTKLSYNVQACAWDCLAHMAFEKCNCVRADYPKNEITRPCEPNDYVNCYSKKVALGGWNSGNDSALIAFTECNDQCLEPCEKQYLTTSVTTSQFPARTVAPRACQLFPNVTQCNNQTYEQYKETYAAVDIYYSRIAYVVLTRFPKSTITNLLSDLGGVVGLWIGASFLTIVDVLEAAVQWCRRRRAAQLVEEADRKPPPGKTTDAM